MKPVLVPCSIGELIDKITILQIKNERIADAAKRVNVAAELEQLQMARREFVSETPELHRLLDELKTANMALWEIEDDIRDCERHGDFGPKFIELARSVYKTNDRRAALKRQINEVSGSALVEEKSYADYQK